MPRVTVSELAVQIEDLIGPVTPTDTVFGYTHIFRHLSAAQRKIRNIVAILKPELLLARADLTITAGTATCDMPANSGGIMLITERNSDGTSAMPINHIEHVGNYVNVAEEDSLEDMMRALEWSSSNGWIEYGNNQIRLFPTPSTSDTYHAYYMPLAADMHSGTVAAAATSSITLASSATYGQLHTTDDYYNAAYVTCTSDAPAGALGQVRLISDYVGSTKVATISAAWTTVPTASSATYEIMPILPEICYDAIVARAAMTLAVMRGMANFGALREEAARAEEELYRTLRNLQLQEPIWLGKV